MCHSPHCYTIYSEYNVVTCVSARGSIDNPFEYVGKFGVMAEDNGLNYMRARFYHPGIRRFISQDTVWGDVASPQSLNLYAYVEGNPVMLVDPSGLDADEYFVGLISDIATHTDDVGLNYAGKFLGYFGAILSASEGVYNIWNETKEGGYYSGLKQIPEEGLVFLSGLAPFVGPIWQEFVRGVFAEPADAGPSLEEIFIFGSQAEELQKLPVYQF